MKERPCATKLIFFSLYRTTKLLKTSLIRMNKDGLNSLKYNLLKTVSHLLYTHLVAEVDPDAM